VSNAERAKPPGSGVWIYDLRDTNDERSLSRAKSREDTSDEIRFTRDGRRPAARRPDRPGIIGEAADRIGGIGRLIRGI